MRPAAWMLPHITRKMFSPSAIGGKCSHFFSHRLTFSLSWRINNLLLLLLLLPPAPALPPAKDWEKRFSNKTSPANPSQLTYIYFYTIFMPSVSLESTLANICTPTESAQSSAWECPQTGKKTFQMNSHFEFTTWINHAPVSTIISSESSVSTGRKTRTERSQKENVVVHM